MNRDNAFRKSFAIEVICLLMIVSLPIVIGTDNSSEKLTEKLKVNPLVFTWCILVEKVILWVVPQAFIQVLSGFKLPLVGFHMDLMALLFS